MSDPDLTVGRIELSKSSFGDTGNFKGFPPFPKRLDQDLREKALARAERRAGIGAPALLDQDPREAELSRREWRLAALRLERERNIVASLLGTHISLTRVSPEIYSFKLCGAVEYLIDRGALSADRRQIFDEICQSGVLVRVCIGWIAEEIDRQRLKPET